MDLMNLYPHLESLGPATHFIDEILEIIDHIPLFEDFNYQEIETLSSHMDCYGAPTGEVLIREGQAGDFLLLVLTGEVEVSKQDPGDGQKRIAVVGPGATLGEMSMVDGEPRFASCITRSPTDFAVLRRQDLYSILEHDSRLSSKFLLVLLQMVTRRLRETSIQLLPHVAGTAL